MPRKKQPEPKQETDKGYKIPVPKKDEFFDALGKAARTPKRPESETGKRRTSRDDR
jgi:hypothetical protein